MASKAYNGLVRALLISTYDMGRQPFGLASPAAWLAEAGVDVACADLSQGSPAGRRRRRCRADCVLPADAHRDAPGAAGDRPRARAESGGATCAYGLYAPLNAALLRAHGVDHVLGGEFEQDLADLAAESLDGDASTAAAGTVTRSSAIPATAHRPAGASACPRAIGLPPLVALRDAADAATNGGSSATPRRAAAASTAAATARSCRSTTAASASSPPTSSSADVRAQVAAGAAAHHLRRSRLLQRDPRTPRRSSTAHVARVPGVTYDVTIKIEHLLQHATMLPLLRDTGCAFVTTRGRIGRRRVLARLEKGHTRADFERVVDALSRRPARACADVRRRSRRGRRWRATSSCCATIDALDLVEHVAPIQLRHPAADSAGIADARTARRPRA